MATRSSVCASVGSLAQTTLKFGEGAGDVMVREQAGKKGKQLKQHAGKVLFFDAT